MPLTELQTNYPGVGQGSATADSSTNSTTYVAMDSMTETVPTAGTYIVMFSASGACSVNTANAVYAIALAGTPVADSERSLCDTGGANSAGMFTAMHSQTVLTAAAGQAITVQYKTEAGVFSVRERVLIILGPILTF